MKALRFLIPLSLVLMICYGIGYLLVTNANATGGGHHNQWGEWEYSRWSDCQPVGECGEEGYQVRTRTRTCERVDGHGEDACEIEKVCEGYEVDLGRLGKYCAESQQKWWNNIGYTDVPQVQEDEQRQRCRLEEYEACSTKRWCFPCQQGEVELLDENGHEYCAEAIPANQEPKEGFPWEEGMDKYCEFPPTPTPTQEPGPPAPEPWSPPAYEANRCDNEGDKPKDPTLTQLGSFAPGCLTWMVEQTDPFSKLMFQYHYADDSVMMGIPELGNQTVTTFDTCGLDSSRYTFGRAVTENKFCASYSDWVDPKPM